jgi:secretion/DNA translocation related CpaE-like protein
MVIPSVHRPLSRPPLICTADDAYLDRAVQWCSAVGATPEVAHDEGMALRTWAGAPFVVVGADLVAPLARAGVRRRPGVFVLAGATSAPWEDAMALGAEDVLRWDETDRALEVLAGAVDGSGEGCLVSVVGGAGGVGASTLAAGLAVACGERGARTLLIDADPLGGGLDLLMGIEHVDGVRWDTVTSAGPMTARALTEVLPASHGVWTLSFGREPATPPAMSNIVTAGTRGFDVVIADVARHCDASEVLARSVLTVVVVPEDVRGVGASKAVVQRLRDRAPSVVGVTAARRPGLGRDSIAEALGIPLVARLRFDQRLRTTIDHGGGPVGSAALRKAVAPLLDLVGVVS